MGTRTFVMNANKVHVGFVVKSIEHLHSGRTDQSENMPDTFDLEGINSGLTARQFLHVSFLYASELK